MKLTVCLEIDDGGPQSGTATPFIASASEFSQHGMPRGMSANFVTHLAATFLRCPQTCARRQIDLRDAIHAYHNVSAAKLVPAGTAICVKT